ncbi:MAG TPA: hypothetical protein VN181_11500 [Thermoanaerobaculia bacterium]|nr:hypothetical protein [Thermoanaerobaculia bacterium]
MPFWISTGAAVVVLYLCWNLSRRFGADRIAALSERRRATSRIVSRGEFFDGNRRLEVALALTSDTFYYENPDMEASLDLQWVREIEYDTRLATGAAIESGKVLRLRCYSQTFEFLLPDDMVARWNVMLPPRGDTRPPATASVGALAATAAGAL